MSIKLPYKINLCLQGNSFCLSLVYEKFKPKINKLKLYLGKIFELVNLYNQSF